MKRVLLFVAAVVLALPACAHRPSTPEDTSAAPLQGATLDVTNLGFVDCDVFVLHDGVRERLGTVVATRSASFELKPAQLGNSGVLQLIAHPIGGNSSYTSEAFAIHDGQSIEWTLEDDLNRSFVSVY